ncbi:MAG: TatD family hydrolase [Endomicrobia bacterium]|nr:TatD family hydrolase [Endomicrobiia bacterium]MDW8056143.1 TatD family hydrolase [Elusimicrobiota bacterium]
MFDTHVHLFNEKLINSFNLDTLLKQLENMHIKGIICICESEPEIDMFINFSQKYPFLYCSVGIHPHNAKDFDEKTLRFLVNKVLHSGKLVAIGETGLDFYYNLSQKEKQIDAFISHIKLAKELSLPIVVHSRNSISEVYKLLLEYKVSIGVMHCFSGDLEFAKKIIDLGLFIGLTGIITFKNYKNLDIVKNVPLEYIVIETDTPYLTPEPYRGKLNTPLNLPLILNKVAQIRNLESNYVEDILDMNAFKLFNLNY